MSGTFLRAPEEEGKAKERQTDRQTSRQTFLRAPEEEGKAKYR